MVLLRMRAVSVICYLTKFYFNQFVYFDVRNSMFLFQFQPIPTYDKELCDYLLVTSAFDIPTATNSWKVVSITISRRPDFWQGESVLR